MKKSLRKKILEKHGGAVVGTSGSKGNWTARLYDTWNVSDGFRMSAQGDTEKAALKNLLALPKKHPSIHPRYGSAWSGDFWELIGSIKDELTKGDLYSLGVDLQNLEAKVLRKLADATGLCLLDSYSSGVCSKATKCCVAKHGEKL